MKQKTETLFKEINHLHGENIGNAQRTAENAVVIGVKFHQLKEILPHSEFETEAQKRCQISDRTRQRYMIIAEERLIEQRALKLLTENAHDGKSVTVALLANPEDQAIPAEFIEQARAQVRADDFKWNAQEIKPKDLARGLEGKDIMDLYRAYDVIRDKKPKQHVAPRELSPEEKVAAENEQAAALVQAAQVAIQVLLTDLQSKTGTLVTRVQPKLWKDILRTTTQFNKLARAAAKRKQSPAEKKQENQAKAKALLSAVESCQTALQTPAPASPFRSLVAEDRLRELQHMKPCQLRQVLAMPTVQKTVRERAEYHLLNATASSTTRGSTPISGASKRLRAGSR